MTLNEIKKRIEAIKSIEHDDEAAHALEDSLYRDVLLAIAEGHVKNVEACAREVLKSRTLGFARWCA